MYLIWLPRKTLRDAWGINLAAWLLPNMLDLKSGHVLTGILWGHLSWESPHGNLGTYNIIYGTPWQFKLPHEVQINIKVKEVLHSSALNIPSQHKH